SLSNILERNGLINTFLESIGLEKVQLINTPGAVILGMVYNFIPYMILPIYSALSKLDHRLLEASSDLGGNGFTTLKRVIIPLSMPGVISGITMVFVPSVSTFYISQKLGGIRNELIGDVIEQQFKLNSNYNLGASLSLILMVMIIISLMIMNKFTADDDDGGVIV
ncbi:MAG: ABC transporter permease, partial [Clostridia bacterium]|nr:ABC transporter permease [Clostridia bacterium]